MRLDRDACRARMTAARVARLATTGRDGRPHLVPVTFAVELATDEAPAPGAQHGVDVTAGIDRIVIGIDQKPKSTLALRRLRNIADNPSVAVLCDHYDEDWSRLWWVRADGEAGVVESGPERDAAVVALSEKYDHYRDDPPRGPVIVIGVESWSGWAFSG